MLFVIKIDVFKKLFRDYHQCQTVLDPDQAQCFVRSDLGPNCLQRLSGDYTSIKLKKMSFNFSLSVKGTLS